LKANFFGKDFITLDFKLGRLITNTVEITFRVFFLQEWATCTGGRRGGGRENRCKILFRKFKEKKLIGRYDVDLRMILKCILKKWGLSV
jgi:hypothetical protein